MFNGNYDDTEVRNFGKIFLKEVFNLDLIDHPNNKAIDLIDKNNNKIDASYPSVSILVVFRK